ncbi:sugar ABC transporter [Sorangium cellulosum]|uniref:Sugar ABC transporter n=1 Tax=Sorangium cellulosum TaxID=56 RepID=A0A4P2PVU2_SORCE|nr:substrate-binding domain-containing protein [Sorangium cellulosum]AUX20681.1 sugar ABC transporter [Sorangium cellulosum]
MTMPGRRWGAAFGLALMMTTACGASDTVDAGREATAIRRTPTPDNEFTPMELEATIDDLIAEINKGSIEPMQMTVLLKELDGFFEPIATGAHRAMGELEVTGNVLGLNNRSGDVLESRKIQNQQIEQMVADGAEAIGVSPVSEDDAAVAVINEAVAKGVHVVTLDSDLPASNRALYVGTLNEAAGATAARTLLPMLPRGAGTVMIHGNVGPEWRDGYDRTQGAKAVIEEAGYTALVTQVMFVGDSDAFDADWMKSQIETADPPVVGMLGLFNLSYRCVMAADAAGKPELPIVAFDFDPKTVDYMRQGRIQATHTQRQYYEGYLVPYILYGIKAIGLDATREILSPLMDEGDLERVNIGIDVIPADKIDAYNAFLDTIGAIQ